MSLQLSRGSFSIMSTSILFAALAMQLLHPRVLVYLFQGSVAAVTLLSLLFLPLQQQQVSCNEAASKSKFFSECVKARDQVKLSARTKSSRDDDGLEAGVPDHQTLTNVAASPVANPVASSQRLIFLDNLKGSLTVLVILYHTSCELGAGGWYLVIANYKHSLQLLIVSLCATLQSCTPFALKRARTCPVLSAQRCPSGLTTIVFMALFFFISGYFVPSSYDRKGSASFLRDKAQRLGLPFCVSVFGLEPLLRIFVLSICTDGDRELVHQYDTPAGGASWFVGWLLLMNAGYTILGGEQIQMPCPSVKTLFLFGLILSIVTALVLLIVGAGAQVRQTS